jgi:uncharacterized protein YkuJ
VAFISAVSVAQEKKAPKKVRVMEQKFDKSDSSPELDSEAILDANGNITEEINYKNGKIAEKTTYKYDANGNKISETRYDKSGNVFETVEYKYEGTLKTEKIVYDAKKKMKNKKTYQYDF